MLIFYLQLPQMLDPLFFNLNFQHLISYRKKYMVYKNSTHSPEYVPWGRGGDPIGNWALQSTCKGIHMRRKRFVEIFVLSWFLNKSFVFLLDPNKILKNSKIMSQEWWCKKGREKRERGKKGREGKKNGREGLSLEVIICS